MNNRLQIVTFLFFLFSEHHSAQRRPNDFAIFIQNGGSKTLAELSTNVGLPQHIVPGRISTDNDEVGTVS